jgi:effector-binding domain-containing protein
MKITLCIILILLILWSAYGYFGSRVEQAEYTVIKKGKGYEIRNYPSHIVAQTTVAGSYGQSMSKGFSIVAGYIFGANAKKQSIAMTSPVVMEGGVSEKIAMTAPVMVNNESDTRTISFGMPKSYTMENLPTPSDSRVKIVEIPNKKFAVLRFTGYRTDSRIQTTEKKLLELLSHDGVEVLSRPSYAGYSAPWTPPWMTRNEVLVEVK